MTVRTDFEPEHMRPPRRHGRFTLLVALCVVVVSAGGLWAAWRMAGHGGANAVVPIIRADGRPVKVPPANPGGMEVPDQDLYVLNHQKPADSKVEQLLPPPETPLPRPVPTTPDPAAAEPLATVAAPAANADALAAAPVTAPTAAPATTPAPAPVTAPAAAPAASANGAVAAPAAAPATTMPATMPAAPPLAMAAATSGYRLQVAAVRSPEVAQREWAKLKRAQADILGALDEQTIRADLGERGIFYRIVAGPIADPAAAQKACETLKQRKVGCILVKP